MQGRTKMHGYESNPLCAQTKFVPKGGGERSEAGDSLLRITDYFLNLTAVGFTIPLI